jgi:LysM repeat protein
MRRSLIFVTIVVFASLIATPVLAADIVHVVQPGENLYRIALRYGVTVDAIAQANGLADTGHIYVGQRLVIPGGNNPSAPPASSSDGVHIVQPGENLYRIALRYGKTVQALAVANSIVNTSRVYVGQRLVIPGYSEPPSAPPSSGQTYIVQRGDTLSSIALRYGVSLWSIAQVNGISNPSLIYVGQELRIPSGNEPVTPPTTAPSPPTGNRWIDVDLSAQRLTAYVGNTAVRSTLVSTGLPRTPTPTGRFSIYAKYVADDMAGPGYYLPDVPYTMYFYRGYAIHGTYWHSNFGHPMSHGCINLPTSEAKWLFYWASAGTIINIRY